MIEIIHSTQELIRYRKLNTHPVAFVPTMGNLHQGHISLLERALHSFDTVYFSIFVNPKQFGPHEDFKKYPRTLESDLEKIKAILSKFSKKKVIVFAPSSTEEVFPAGDNLVISVCDLSFPLEGKMRPGHFEGVATVVYRLFELIRPHTAYFGLKDFQQYMVIKKMVKDLALYIEVVGMPIIREKSGLALSSRNQYLSLEEKKEALILFKTLTEIKEIIHSNKNNIPKAQAFIEQALRDKKWNYLELRDTNSFCENITLSKNITVLGVYQIGTTRLLDNLQMELN